MVKTFAMLAVLLGCSSAWATDEGTDKDTLAERIAPVGQVCIEGKPCAAATAAAAAVAAPAASASTATRTPEQLVQQVCSGCHGSGVMGAPKIGDKADWAPRIAKGMDTLLNHALNGFNNKMPPRGTCTTCTDDEIKAAIQYMTDKSR